MQSCYSNHKGTFSKHSWWVQYLRTQSTRAQLLCLTLIPVKSPFFTADIPLPHPLDENCSYRAWIAIYLTYHTISWRIRLRVLYYFTQGLSRASELKKRENRNPRRRGRKTNSSKNREFSIRIRTLEKNLKSNVLRYRGSAIARNHGHFGAVNNCQRCIKLRFRRTLAAVAARSRKQRVCIDVLHNLSSADI